MQDTLKRFLDRKVDEYNQPSFILTDPVCIPHAFTKKQDIEITMLNYSVFVILNRQFLCLK